MKSATVILFLLCFFNVVEYFGSIFNVFNIRWGSVKMEMHWGNGKTPTFLLLKRN